MRPNNGRAPGLGVSLEAFASASDLLRCGPWVALHGDASSGRRTAISTFLPVKTNVPTRSA
jgi:hypothetical protein